MNPRLRLAICALLLTFAGQKAADAAVFVGLVLDPLSPAGYSPNAPEGLSGPGTWQLFAVDDGQGDFGISGYNVELAGTTLSRHRSPVATGLIGTDGESYEAGFNMLREVRGDSTSTSIHASQPLPGMSPFLLSGLGQRTGDFASAANAVALQPFGPIRQATSPAWGNYESISPLNGNNWMLIADGTYDAGILPSISKAAFTAYDDTTNFRSSVAKSYVIPDPITPSLLTPEYLEILTTPPPPPPVVVVEPPAPPVVVPPVAPPLVNDPPVYPDYPPVEDPHQPVVEQPGEIIVPDDLPPPLTWAPIGTEIPNDEGFVWGSPIIDVVDPWWEIRTGYLESDWHLNEGDWTVNLTDWIPSDFVVAYDTPSYLTNLTYLDLDADGSVLVAAPVSFTHGTAVAELFGATPYSRFSANASSSDGSLTVFDSSPAAAPEPTAAILSAIGLATLAALTRRGRR